MIVTRTVQVTRNTAVSAYRSPSMLWLQLLRANNQRPDTNHLDLAQLNAVAHVLDYRKGRARVTSRGRGCCTCWLGRSCGSGRAERAIMDSDRERHYQQAMKVAQAAWDFVNPPDGSVPPAVGRDHVARYVELERQAHKLRRLELDIATDDGVIF